MTFLPARALAEGWNALDVDALGHAKVLRLRAGDEVTLFSGDGRSAHVVLAERGGLGAEVTSINNVGGGGFGFLGGAACTTP